MEPFVIVIFGATGDLAQNKLLPALFSLFKQNILGKQFLLIGFARRQFTDDEYRKMLKVNLSGNKNKKQWKEFIKHVFYQQGMFDEQTGYKNLISRLQAYDRQVGFHVQRLFYLATPPDNYETILDFLHKTNLSASTSSKLIVEKPFGKDLETAYYLDRKIAKLFEEHQLYRVDHYLAKEVVQNMIAFRFANSIFEPVWNKNYIDHVQITWFEKEGVRQRGKFFDGVGMLRDVGQNHLLQLLAAVAMEQPKTFSKEGVRDVRAQAIKAIRLLSPNDVKNNVIRGQYRGYHQEKDIDPKSTTETFVAMKFFVDSPRLETVPFYLRVGKKIATEIMDIKIVFKQTCQLLFREYGCPEVGNVLTIRVQPNEGINIGIVVKTPGAKVALSKVEMKFTYEDSFKQHGLDAYEKLLIDILDGDQMLFNRSDELESSWQLISAILQIWEKEEKKKIPIYGKKSFGPKQAIDLIERDGRKWYS